MLARRFAGSEGWRMALFAGSSSVQRPPRYLHLTRSLKCAGATKHLLSAAEDLFT